MPDISNEIAAIQVATTGAEIRSAVIEALSVINSYVPSYYSGSYSVAPSTSSITLQTASKGMYYDVTISAIPTYSGSYVITPSTVSQTFSVANLYMESDITVEAVPSYSGSYVITPSTVSQTFSVANLYMASDITVEAVSMPTYSGSYVITPSTVSQTFSVANLYMESDITVEAVPSYSGSYIITPSTVSQTFSIANLYMESDIMVESYNINPAFNVSVASYYSFNLESSWSGEGPYSQNIEISDVTFAEDTVIMVIPTESQLSDLRSAGVDTFYVTPMSSGFVFWITGSSLSTSMELSCIVM